MKTQQIITGDKFLCKKNVVMKSDGKVAYVKGQTYTSESDGCITDEQGTALHWWADTNTFETIEAFSKFFTPSKDVEGGKVHELKTVHPYFNELLAGKKTFELRFNDRDFQVGDTLVLKEYAPPDHDFMGGDEYSGRQVRAIITSILKDFKGLEPGYCILSLRFI